MNKLSKIYCGISLFLLNCNNIDSAGSSFNISLTETTSTSDGGTGIQTSTKNTSTDNIDSDSTSNMDSGSQGQNGDAICGNNILEGTEECDLGTLNSDSSECTSLCKLSFCGDGLINTESEKCDDGSKNGLYPKDHRLIPHCNNTCDGNGPFCGDGVIQENEDCDPKIPGMSCESECFVEARYIFVSALPIEGNLLNLPLSEICNFLSEGIEIWKFKNFRPWLSTSEISPDKWFDKDFIGIYYNLRDGKKFPIAFSWEGLTSGKLQYPIIGTELGFPLDQGEKVWTNTKYDGKSMNLFCCNGWDDNSNTQIGQIGNPFATDKTWTNLDQVAQCDQHIYHIYCVEDY